VDSIAACGGLFFEKEKPWKRNKKKSLEKKSRKILGNDRNQLLTRVRSPAGSLMEKK